MIIPVDIGRGARVLRFARTTPILMSMLALALVFEGMVEFGNHPPADEGWQAHIFQMLLAFQLPLVAAHAVWGERRLVILAIQSVLWIVAAASAAYLFP